MKKLKLILPALAFAAAIGTALVTKANTHEMLADRVSQDFPSECKDIGSCDGGVSTACQTSNLIIYTNGVCAGSPTGAFTANP